VTFASQAANTTSTRTIEFGAKYVVNDHFGTPITEQSSSPASLTVTVTPPAAGPYITSPKTSTVLFEPASSFPGEQFFCGAVVGATGTPSVIWTATQVSSGTTTVIPAIDLSLFGCAYGADWKITPLPNDSYTIMMTARDSMGNLIGTPATVSMNFVTTF
jgi:hypothetical protein